MAEEGTETLSDDDTMSQVASTSSSMPASPISPGSQIPTPVAKKPKKQAPTKNDAIAEALLKAEQEKIDYLKRKEEKRARREEMYEERVMDEDMAFFNSILPHVKRLSPKSKIKFRIDVLKLIENELTSLNINDQPRQGQHVPNVNLAGSNVLSTSYPDEGTPISFTSTTQASVPQNYFHHSQQTYHNQSYNMYPNMQGNK